MSTKTTFKRIALVAVAALGAGVLSVAPSQAATTAQANTVTLGTSVTSIALGETATANLAVKFTSLTAGESTSVQAVITGAPTGGASASVRLSTVDSSTNTNISYASTGLRSAAIDIASDGGTTTKGFVGSKAVGLVAATLRASLVSAPVAGTYTIGIFSSAYGATGGIDAAVVIPAIYVTITVAAALAPDATSTSYITTGNAIPAVADSATVLGIKTSGTQAATILTTQNIAGVAATGASLESYTAIITGSGTLSSGSNTNDTTNAGRAITVKYNDYIQVRGDGTSGVGTVTITGATTGRAYATKTVTFYDPKPASVTVTVKKAYPAAGQTTVKAVYVNVKDASGNNVTDPATAIVLQPQTAGVGDTLTSSACAWSGLTTVNAWVCSIKGASTAKFGKVAYKAHVTGNDVDATEITSAAFDVTFADVVATKITVTAPATAAVGEKVTVTFTATEKNGYPVADTTYEGAHNDSTLSQFGGKLWGTGLYVPSYSSASFQPFNNDETITTTSGVGTVSLYVPAVAGDLKATWTLAGTAGSLVSSGAIDKSIVGTTTTLTIKVASEALEAANAATTAALAANDAVDALAATVAKLVANLKAQITALTKLIVKIQKKVGA